MATRSTPSVPGFGSKAWRPGWALCAVMGHGFDALEGRFGEKMTSHRAGRWAFDSRYARLLVEHGYLVDCSVTPIIPSKMPSGGSAPGPPAW